MQTSKPKTMVFTAALCGLALSTQVVLGKTGLAYTVIPYKEDSTALEGHYYPPQDKSKGLRPAFLLFPDWMGMTPVADQYAQKWSKLGFAVFVADIYGKGKSPNGKEEAAQLSSAFKNNRPLMRARAQAALKTLLAQKATDPNRISSIGYCFGGTCALELARSGAEIAGTISLHGGLDTPNSGDAKQIKGKVIALHGGDDPFVPPEQVGNFVDEMRNAKVDWQLVEFGGAVHGFTNPNAPLDPSQGFAFNPVAEKRSTEIVKIFTHEIFNPDSNSKKP